MKPSLIKLQKFFKLEAEREYDNRAVLGGLSRMLEPWEAEARQEGLPEDLISAVLSRLRDYNRLSPASRQEALQGLWRRIQSETGTAPLPVGEEIDDQPPPQVPQERPQKVETDAPPAEEQTANVDIEMQSAPEPEPKSAAESEQIKPGKSTLSALNAPVTVLPGVGPKYAKTLERLGLETLEDMLYFFPRRYDDYSYLKPINRLEYGEQVTVIGTVQNATTRKVRDGKVTITEGVISDGTGNLRATWFNQPWISKKLRPGVQVVLSGKIDQYLGRITMNSPEIEQIDQQNLHTNRIVPVYPLTANITQRWLRQLMHRVVTYWAPKIEDTLPESLRKTNDLADITQAIFQIHFPDSIDQLKSARHRLAFEEILYLQLGMLAQKRAWQERTARVFTVPDDWLQNEIEKLPFQLTSAQHNALTNVRSDLASGHPMNRLLQGDVGSGKTVIAALGIGIVVRNTAQAALMAPTSILAEQHYASMKQILAGEQGILSEAQIRLMIGATPESEKNQIREGLANGEIKLVIGTHALIEEPVIFADLQLTIIDEQHRFGVEQRAALRDKGENPHLMVMTATPIPRSLALTVYGDLDLLVMDEMPPGRQAIDTHILLPRERERAYTLIRKEISQGSQAFIIYPLIENNAADGDQDPFETSQAAVDEHLRLQNEVFPEYMLGLLHGKLKPDEKEQTMKSFRDGEYQILVSTSVVEVGVDIPNATVMMVEGANRFGLAQLHQFRGRVGRGDAKSYCLLIPESEDAAENERLSAMVTTNDGFVLAEMDLDQRGPGDFLGTRQSGYTKHLQLASLTDLHLIEKAQQTAKSLFSQDPDLSQPEHQNLGEALAHFWGQNGHEIRSDIS
ncbi:MAG: ATP-dependent DNA helicase RecG [Chloroflexota bacterium]|nr:MAG: ATP-dependent DNA helicase RecG [Chloroflexota bacterium]